MFMQLTDAITQESAIYNLGLVRKIRRNAADSLTILVYAERAENDEEDVVLESLEEIVVAARDHSEHDGPIIDARNPATFVAV